MKLQSDLREFIELLNSRKVDYLVVGGHAVAFHGYPRFTGDVDFFIDATPDNARRVLLVLEDFGFGSLGLDVQSLTQAGKVIQLGRPPNRIDLLTSISGLEFKEAWNQRVAAELDAIPVHFVSKEALIKNKRAAARSKDLADVDALVASDAGGKN